MSRLLENDSLDLLAHYRVPVPVYRTAETPDEAASIVEKFGGRAVLKALVPAGKRGLAGAVRFVSSSGEAEDEARRILGMTVRYFPVKRLIIMETLEIRREFFFSITFDPTRKCPVVLFSPTGGVDIEEITAKRPEHLFELPVNIIRGLEVYQCTDFIETSGIKSGLALKCARAAQSAYQAFRAADSRMIEINPLAELVNGEVIAGSGAVILDEQALFRQPELEKKLGEEQGNGWRPLTELESCIRKIDSIDPHVCAIRFNELDGDIAFLVSGGGYGLSSFEQIIREGGRPATTFDITPGPFEEKMFRIVKAVCKMPGLRGMVLSANVSNFARVDRRVAGIVRALKELDIDYEHFPVIVRYDGPGAGDARKMMAEVPGPEMYGAESTLEDICKRIVERSYDNGVKPE